LMSNKFQTVRQHSTDLLGPVVCDPFRKGVKSWEKH
jgi:hypothetical protein